MSDQAKRRVVLGAQLGRYTLQGTGSGEHQQSEVLHLTQNRKGARNPARSLAAPAKRWTWGQRVRTGASHGGTSRSAEFAPSVRSAWASSACVSCPSEPSSWRSSPRSLDSMCAGSTSGSGRPSCSSMDHRPRGPSAAAADDRSDPAGCLHGVPASLLPALIKVERQRYPPGQAMSATQLTKTTPRCWTPR